MEEKYLYKGTEKTLQKIADIGEIPVDLLKEYIIVYNKEQINFLIDKIIIIIKKNIKYKLVLFEGIFLDQKKIAQKINMNEFTLGEKIKKAKLQGIKINENWFKNNLIVWLKEQFINNYYKYLNKNTNLIFLEYMKNIKSYNYNKEFYEKILTSLNIESLKNPNLNIKEFVTNFDIKI